MANLTATRGPLALCSKSSAFALDIVCFILVPGFPAALLLPLLYKRGLILTLLCFPPCFANQTSFNVGSAYVHALLHFYLHSIHSIMSSNLHVLAICC